jgi:hypothetical protein
MTGKQLIAGQLNNQLAGLVEMRIQLEANHNKLCGMCLGPEELTAPENVILAHDAVNTAIRKLDAAIKMLL